MHILPIPYLCVHLNLFANIVQISSCQKRWSKFSCFNTSNELSDLDEWSVDTRDQREIRKTHSFDYEGVGSIWFGIALHCSLSIARDVLLIATTGQT